MTSDLNWVFFIFKTNPPKHLLSFGCWLCITFVWKHVIIFIIDKCVMFFCVYTTCQYLLHASIYMYCEYRYMTYVYSFTGIYHVNDFNHEQLISKQYENVSF